jgi:hypothetical protein
MAFLTDKERVDIHRILGIGISSENIYMINYQVACIEQRGLLYQLKEILSDENLDKLTLSRFLCIEIRLEGITPRFF